MTKEVLAVVLLWFIVVNLITYFLFRTSHQRVNIRLPPLSGTLLSGLAIAGGGPAAVMGFRLHSNTRHGIMRFPVAAAIALIQLALLFIFVVDLLIVDIF